MIKIKTALISVFDKTGILDLAEKLASNNIEIISSGGTAKYLKENGFDVTEVSDYTASPEVFDGRVKTLHPKIHAGILARGQKDSVELKMLGAKKIDLVVVNLYPFSDEVAKNSSDQEIIEKIDIGGPAMLRAAAKNFQHTVVLCSPEQYDGLKVDSVNLEQSKEYAGHVFSQTHEYDLTIAEWLSAHNEQLITKELRYGENPHQKAKLLTDDEAPIDFLNPLQGKEISYNNVADSIASWACVSEFEEPSICIVKHTNPCGVASDEKILEAYRKAFKTDPTSAFGGVIASNIELDESTVEEMLNNQFIEVLIAPNYSTKALEMLKSKPNIRVLRSRNVPIDVHESKHLYGVGLMQSTDIYDLNEIKLDVVTNNMPKDSEKEDLIFAMKIAKHVKSNAIVLAKNKMTLGIGAGQMSRVVSTKIAFMKAEEEGLNVEDCVLASDAFFPFRDNIDLAAEKGAKHIIQPGGSVKDNEVISAANEHKLTMALTGVRHFKH